MKKRFLTTTILLICLLLFASSAWAQAAFVRSAASSCASGACTTGDTQLVFALDATGGSGLHVFAGYGCSSGSTGGVTIATITYAAQSLTVQAGAQNPAAQRSMQEWALAAATTPTTGTNNVTVTIAAPLATLCSSGRLFAGAILLSGTDSSTLFAAGPTGASGTGTTPAVTLASSTSNDLVIHSACTGDTLASPTGTSRWNNTDTSASCNSYGGATASGGTTALQWTTGSDSWSMIAASVKGASGGGSSIIPIVIRQFRARWAIIIFFVLFSALAAPKIGFGKEVSDEHMERVLGAHWSGRDHHLFAEVRDGSGEPMDSIREDESP